MTNQPPTCAGKPQVPIPGSPSDLAGRYRIARADEYACHLTLVRRDGHLRLPVEVEISNDLLGREVLVRFGRGGLHHVGPKGACSCLRRCLHQKLVAAAQLLGFAAFRAARFPDAYRLDRGRGAVRLHLTGYQFPDVICGPDLPWKLEATQTIRGGATVLHVYEDAERPLESRRLVCEADAPCACGDPCCWHAGLLGWLAAEGFEPWEPLPGDLYQEVDRAPRRDVFLFRRPALGTTGFGPKELPRTLGFARTATGGRLVVLRDHHGPGHSAACERIERFPGSPVEEPSHDLEAALLERALARGFEPYAPQRFPQQGVFNCEDSAGDPDLVVTARATPGFRFQLVRTSAGGAVLVRRGREARAELVGRDGRCTCSAGLGWDLCPHRAAVAQADWDAFRPRRAVWSEDTRLRHSIRDGVRDGVWLWDREREEARLYRELGSGTYELSISRGQRRLRRVRAAHRELGGLVVFEAEECSALGPELAGLLEGDEAIPPSIHRSSSRIDLAWQECRFVEVESAR